MAERKGAQRRGVVRLTTRKPPMWENSSETLSQRLPCPRTPVYLSPVWTEIQGHGRTVQKEKRLDSAQEIRSTLLLVRGILGRWCGV